MVTVFTPVYNRAYIIGQLYQSLLRQTNYHFEWLVIDDGSTDNIAEMMGGWIADTREFDIRFYRQINGGKHRAVNRGVQLARGDAFMIVDSDDYLTDDAVDTVLKYWVQIKNKPAFAGISGLRMYKSMQVIGSQPLFGDYVDATNLERNRYGLQGDKAEVYKTDVLREVPFPEYEGEKFVTEAVVWDKIAYRGLKIRWFNKGIVICNYLGDGLTANSGRLQEKNPRGWAAYLRGERIYQAWSRELYLRRCLYYYEIQHLYITADKMRELLEIDMEEMAEVERAYFSLRERFAETCRDKKVSIYAFGAWGMRLKGYLDGLGIPIHYVVDRKILKVEGMAWYTPDADLPETEVMFVALKNGAEDIIPMLCNKLEGSRIINLKEFVGEWW